MSSKNVLVTGASGYIGSAVARAFVRSGWKTYGLVRRKEATEELSLNGIEPVLGSPDDISWLRPLCATAHTFEVIVSVTEDMPNYVAHYDAIVRMARLLAKISGQAGVRPLVLFTSGCKDYGRTSLDGDRDLRPSVEQGGIAPPPFAANRASHAIKIFKNVDVFDAIVLRPVTVYGWTSSFYADAFIRAAEARDGDRILVVPSDPRSIAHGCHVDDCAEAYVALAETAPRWQVIGQAFNISGRRYETASQIAEALVKEYGLEGVRYAPEPGTEDEKFGNMLFAFSQWVSSEKIREVAKWTDYRPLFSEGIALYRKEYEEAKEKGSYAVSKTAQLLERVKSGGDRLDQ